MTQNLLIKPMVEWKCALDEDGVCNGITYMGGMPAILAEDVGSFDKRFWLIARFEVKQLINKIANRKRQLSRVWLKTKFQGFDPLLEIPAFFEGIGLYQYSELYNRLFKSTIPLVNQDAQPIIPLVLSQKLEKQGGIFKFEKDFGGVYNEETLTVYLDSLRQHLIANRITKPVALILESINHVITVGYNPKNDQWIFIDPNQLPSQRFTNSKEIARKVISAFSANEYAVFQTKFYGINDGQRPDLSKALESWLNDDNWKKIHTVSAENSTWCDSFKVSLLFIAARIGDLEVIKSLLESTADKDGLINSADSQCFTPLMVAAQYGHLNIVELLIKNKANVNAAAGFNEMTQTPKIPTALSIAVTQGHLSVVDLLIKKGAFVDPVNSKGNTPLFRAATNNFLAIAQLLVTSGAKLDSKNIFGKSSLFFAAQNGHLGLVKSFVEKGMVIDQDSYLIAVKNGHLDVVKFLIESAHVDLTVDNSLISHAAANGHLDIVEYLITNGAEVNTAVDDGISGRKTPFLRATEGGHIKVVEYLVQKGAPVDQVDEYGSNLLLRSAFRGHFEVVDYLIKNNTKIASSDMETALLLAVREGHFAIVELLVKNGAKVNPRNFTQEIFEAAQKGYFEIVKFLVENGVKFDGPDLSNKTLLLYAAENGYLDIVEYLIEHGVEIGKSQTGNQSPIFTAAMNGHLDVVECFLKKAVLSYVNDEDKISDFLAELEYVIDMAELELRSGSVSTKIEMCLFTAAINGYVNIAEFLIQNGARVWTTDKNGASSFFYAAISGQIAMAKFILEKDNTEIETRDKFGATPIFYAAQKGQLEMVEFLQSEGANINLSDRDGATLIMHATLGKHLNVVEFLAGKNSELLDVANKWGITPLMVAAELGSIELVKFFILNGAKLDAIDLAGNTPISLAQKHNHDDIVKLLENELEEIPNLNDLFALTEINSEEPKEKEPEISVIQEPNLNLTNEVPDADNSPSLEIKSEGPNEKEPEISVPETSPLNKKQDFIKQVCNYLEPINSTTDFNTIPIDNMIPELSIKEILECLAQIYKDHYETTMKNRKSSWFKFSYQAGDQTNFKVKALKLILEEFIKNAVEMNQHQPNLDMSLLQNEQEQTNVDVINGLLHGKHANRDLKALIDCRREYRVFTTATRYHIESLLQDSNPVIFKP